MFVPVAYHTVRMGTLTTSDLPRIRSFQTGALKATARLGESSSGALSIVVTGGGSIKFAVIRFRISASESAGGMTPLSAPLIGIAHTSASCEVPVR